MKKEFAQEIDYDEEEYKKFMPFRNRKTFWGDPTKRPLIPNVATVIPPDVNPELLRILLYRMKLEEISYKASNLNTQAINIIYKENKLDNYLFPNQNEAILSKANECIRFELHSLITEIDHALPPVLPPPIILPATAKIPPVKPIKTPFNIQKMQSQESTLLSEAVEYSEDANNQDYQPSKDETSQESDAQKKEFDENANNNDNPPLSTYQPMSAYSPYIKSYSKYKPSNDLQLAPPSSTFDDDRRNSNRIDFSENHFSMQQSPQFQDPNQQYSVPPYRYPQPPPFYDEFSPLQNSQKQQIPPPSISHLMKPPPPFLQNQNNFHPLSPPPPLPTLPPPPPPPPSKGGR